MQTSYPIISLCSKILPFKKKLYYISLLFTLFSAQAMAQEFSITATDANKDEGNVGNTAFTFTITRSISTGDNDVTWTVSGGGTTTTADFGGTFPSGSVNFADTEDTKIISINVSGDTDVEGNEGFTVTLSNPTGDGTPTLATDPTATGTIQNDDTQLNIVATSANKAEGSGGGNTPFTFTVTRSGDLGGANAVTWTVTGSGGNAADAADFDAVTGTINFTPTAPTRVITVNVIRDTDIEEDEGFTVTLSAPTNGATLGTATAIGTIQNDDKSLSIAATDADQVEGNAGNTPFTFTVTRSGDLSTVSSASWIVAGSGSNPNAASANDFGGTFPTGSVSFAIGETAKLITVNVSGDAVVEEDEGFTITLNAPVGATIATASASGTIQNDDSPPSLTITATDAIKDEGNIGASTFLFTVTRSGNLVGSSTVNWELSGSGDNPADNQDFTGPNLPSGSLTFNTGETNKTITINVRGDIAVENDEGFTITLSNVADADISVGTAAGLIQNDDSLPRISFATSTGSTTEGNSGNTNVTITLNISNASAVTLPVTISLSGTATYGTGNDYTTTPNGSSESFVVNFPANSTASQTFTLVVRGDTQNESDETVIFTIQESVLFDIGTNKVHTHTIANDDFSSTVYLVAEGVVVTNDGNSDPSDDQRILSVPDAGEIITFTALPLDQAYKFIFAADAPGIAVEDTMHIDGSETINGEEVVLNDNVLKIKLVPNNIVRVVVTIGSQELETNNIVASNTILVLPSTICIDQVPLQFKISDSVWESIRPENTASNTPSTPGQPGVRIKRMDYTNFTVISENSQFGTITEQNLIDAGGTIGSKTIYIVCAQIDEIGNELYTFDYALQSIQVGEGTEPSILNALESTFCKDDTNPIELVNFAEPVGGVFTIDGNTTPTTTLQPSSLSVGEHVITYTFINNFGCERFTTKTITVNPTPSAAFTFQNTCIGDVTQFVATNDDPNITWNWTIGNNPFSNEKEPSFTFAAPGTYQVRLTVRDALTQCDSVALQEVRIHALPIAGFTFDNTCSLSPNFINESAMQASNPTDNEITEVIWNFGDGSEVTIPYSSNTGNTSHTYADYGSYQVELTINTSAGCSSVITKTVNLFPSITLDAVNNSYIENFDNGDGNWISGGINSSWKRTIPPGDNITNTEGTDEVWMTNNADNSYNTNEKSYIESPCFDIRNIPNPMINLRIWTDTDISGDGALLLYTIENTENSKWQAVSLKAGNAPNIISQKGGGINWYNQENLLGGPSTELNIIDNPLKVGWAGKDSTWKVAKFSLDDVQRDAIQNGTGVVRFRIAFGSNSDNPANITFNGFAVDTILITERDRLTLVEHFTNTQAITNATSERELNEILGLEDTQKTIIVRYLTGFPVSDPNITTFPNIADNTARALYYGVAELTRTLVDGVDAFQKNPNSFVPGTDYWNDFKAAQTQRILSQPNVRIPAITVSPEAGQTALRVQFDLSQNISALPISNNFLVQACLIQKELPAPFGDFKNVVKAFLPSLSGIARLTWQDLDTPMSFDFNWEPTEDITPNDYKLVVFIQDEVTGEVYQAQDAEIPFQVDAPGGRQSQADPGTPTQNAIGFDFVIYPNPSLADCNIWLSTPQEEAKNWILRDTQGKVIFTGEVPAQTQLMKLRLDDLAAGVYTLQIGKTLKRLVVE